MTYAGFDRLIDGLLSTSLIALSDDPSPLDATDSVINPSGGDILTSPAEFAPILSRPGRHVFSSRMNRTRVASLKMVRRFGLTQSDKSLMAVSVMEGSLELSGIGGLRGHYALRLRNAEQPRHFPLF
jgi:hypothetical protein